MTQTFNHGYALLIGVGAIAKYPDWSLPVTVKDMTALRNLLTDPARCAYPTDDDHVRLLHDQHATRQAMLDELAWLKTRAEQDPDATIAVYYSGHGWVDEATGRYYLIPHDVEPFDLQGSALAASDFNDALRAIPAKRLLVFIDSCHAGGMATAKEMSSVKLPQGFAKSAPPATELEALQEGEGRAVFTSSRGDQRSWVRTDNTLSIFTYHLLEALQGAANLPGDEVARLSHLMNHLDRTVPLSAMQMANAEQRPFVNLASEDFPVALLLGGKGLPKGGWPAVEQDARRTIHRLIHVEGDRNVVAESITGGVIQTGDNSVATGGAAYVGGGVDAKGDFIGRDQIQAEHYYGDGSKVTIGEDKQAKLIQARMDYLRRLRTRCQVLPMAAIGGEDGTRDSVRLDQLYVELETLTPVARPDEAVEYGERQVRFIQEERKPLSAMEAATLEARLALLGDPGSGKSTFVKQLAAWLTSAGLGENEPPEGWSAATLPLLTVLRDLAPRLSELALDGVSADERNRRIIKALHDQWRADVEALPMSPDPVMEVLEAALGEGKALVIFDGLDEVPEGARARVGWMLDALLAAYPDIAHVIVTCRVRSYVGDAVLPDFGDHRLAPFDEEKIKHFVQGWYQAQVDMQRLTPNVAKARRDDLTQAALSDDLKELAENPMLLTTMAIIHQRDVGLPKERVRLYHQAVTVLLHRWQRHKGTQVSHELAKVLADELKMRAILERLAHDAHQQEVEEQGKLRFGGLIEVLSGPDFLGNLALAGEFLDYVDEKAGVLVGEGGSERAGRPVTYGFPHRTFQEYLAGCHLIGHRPSARLLRPYAETGDFWYLAAQLAGEELLYNRRSKPILLDLMYDLCATAEPASDRDWRTALWSGRMAKLIGSVEIAKDTEPGGGSDFLARLTQRMVAIVNDGRLTPPERADAGRILSVLGDPRPGVGVVNGVPDIAWRPVPGGEFWMGADDSTEDAQAIHKLDLPDFRIAKYPMTNAQYAAFVAATGQAVPHHWRGNEPPEELMNHPVVNVTWHDAVAFCAWLSERLGETIRLPSEAEWEKAAKGDQDNRRYPWGDDEPDETLCNFDMNIGTTTSVGMYPAGDSPYRCCDMGGNVWEWTLSKREEYPYEPTDGREDAAGYDRRVLRGGAFYADQSLVRCAFRSVRRPDGRYVNHGFRVCAPGP